jgi:hypothetical protein
MRIYLKHKNKRCFQLTICFKQQKVRFLLFFRTSSNTTETLPLKHNSYED